MHKDMKCYPPSLCLGGRWSHGMDIGTYLSDLRFKLAWGRSFRKPLLSSRQEMLVSWTKGSRQIGDGGVSTTGLTSVQWRERGVKMVPMVSFLVKWVNGHHSMRWKYMRMNRLGRVGDQEIKPPRLSNSMRFLVSFPQQTDVRITQRMLNEPWQFLCVDVEDWRQLFCKQNTLPLALRPMCISY